MQRFGNIDKVGRTMVLHVSIEFAYIAHAYNMVEAQIIGKSLIHLLLLYRHCGHRRIGGVERHEQEALFIRQEVEYAYMGCRRSESAVITVGNAVEHIICGI